MNRELISQHLKKYLLIHATEEKETSLHETPADKNDTVSLAEYFTIDETYSQVMVNKLFERISREAKDLVDADSEQKLQQQEYHAHKRPRLNYQKREKVQ